MLLNGLVAMAVFAAVRALLRPDLIDTSGRAPAAGPPAPRAADGRAQTLGSTDLMYLPRATSE